MCKIYIQITVFIGFYNNKELAVYFGEWMQGSTRLRFWFRRAGPSGVVHGHVSWENPLLAEKPRVLKASDRSWTVASDRPLRGDKQGLCCVLRRLFEYRHLETVFEENEK